MEKVIVCVIIAFIIVFVLYYFGVVDFMGILQ